MHITLLYTVLKTILIYTNNTILCCIFPDNITSSINQFSADVEVFNLPFPDICFWLSWIPQKSTLGIVQVRL